MNGRDLTLGFVGALAVGAALGRRGSRATDLTSTPAFRRWFGESKVVDAEGRPLAVFHGSVEAGFDSFIRRGIGIYFTGDYEAAQLYAGSWDAGEWTNTDDAHRVYRVYLQITNPLVVDAKGADYHDIVFHDLPAPIRKAIGKPPYRAAHVEIEDIARIAPRLGYDGVIVRNVVDEAGQEPGGVWWREDASPTNVYVVFSPTQIKSATGNRGTFDPADPRISFNRSAPTDAALRTLRAAMVKAARADTAYAPATWKRAKDPLTGHCYAAAHLVQDRFGGEIVKGTVRGQAHAWNRLPGGREVDLTGSQYGGDGMRPLVKGEGIATSRSTNPRFARFAARVDAQLGRR
jgi:hypothetical protein